ncbi:SpaH/EbpB family LPXTG-anchored major pilin [Candidatus Enterococcus ferrettii]|uniref:Uncharacterized protein n=1 Tax=Candidatus Enterococcus ferrettii TaxID=2815324 RepID=A0ABV0ESH5_9ENTE|nr:SpaH/EbpB family LPXTG-anchored major pilin [Enterococcus sp. 665A]MBO1341644.1 SpaH/EbpB family LPXTG-anchored major pilin [Enterococcus sp. 665A]
MRKKISKLITMLFILATILGGGLSALAAPGAKPTKGDLTIHKHWAETANDIQGEGTGEKLNPGITNPAISGIQFDVYQLTPKGNPLAPATPPSDKDGWTYTRTNNELTVAKGAVEHKYDLTKKTSATTGGKTDTNGELKYTDLPAGYYYVEENLAASTGYQVQGTGNEDKKITSGAKPFIVAVPMTTADGTDWNDDVHVYPKNQGLNPEKKPEKPSVNVGDKVKWTITANVPAGFADYKQFVVTDELDKRLNYVGTPAHSVVVKGIDASSNLLVTLNNPADYTVAHTAATPADKEKIVITLTTAGIAKLAAATGIEKISIDFETTVNGNILNDGENKIENKADIDFENGSSETGKITTDPSEIHTGEIKINKSYSGGDTSINKSAQFQLAASEAAAKAGEYYRVILDATSTHIVDIVAPGETGFDTAKKWVAIPSHAIKSETLGLDGDTFYVESFEGLQTYTEDAGGTKTYNKYYLVETLAPDKYNLLDGPVEVTFENADTQHVETKAIENKRGFTLPNTGGAGTLLMVIGGIVLIGLAVLLTMNKKKAA